MKKIITIISSLVLASSMLCIAGCAEEEVVIEEPEPVVEPYTVVIDKDTFTVTVSGDTAVLDNTQVSVTMEDTAKVTRDEQYTYITVNAQVTPKKYEDVYIGGTVVDLIEYDKAKAQGNPNNITRDIEYCYNKARLNNKTSSPSNFISATWKINGQEYNEAQLVDLMNWGVLVKNKTTADMTCTVVIENTALTAPDYTISIPISVLGATSKDKLSRMFDFYNNQLATSKTGSTQFTSSVNKTLEEWKTVWDEAISVFTFDVEVTTTEAPKAKDLSTALSALNNQPATEAPAE